MSSVVSHICRGIGSLNYAIPQQLEAYLHYIYTYLLSSVIQNTGFWSPNHVHVCEHCRLIVKFKDTPGDRCKINPHYCVYCSFPLLLSVC